MKRSSRFVEDWEEFNKPDRFVPRSASLLSEGNTASFPRKPEELIALLRNDLVNREGHWFRCWSFSVRVDDGMSWTAERVRMALEQDRPTFRSFCFPKLSSVDGLPRIAALIGQKTFLRLAARRGVTTSFFTLRSWLTPAIFGLSLALALAAKVLEIVFKLKSPQIAAQVGHAFVDSTFWLVGGVSVVVGLVSQQLTTWLTTRTRSKSMANFLSDLPRKMETQEYRDLIEDLAGELRGAAFPRFVIIESFDRLDSTTQQVIDRYFRTHTEHSRGLEFWVIFEREDRKTFSSLRALHPRDAGYGKVQRARQLPLDTLQKQALVAMLNLPAHAAEFQSVKRVCRPHADPSGRYTELFQDYRQHHPSDLNRYSDLDLLNVLALTASPGEVMLTDRFVRNNFSIKTGLHAELLKTILRGSQLQKAEFEHRLQALRANFDSALVLDDQNSVPRLRVSVEAAEVLERMAGDLALAPPGLVHLFWAIFWGRLLAEQPVEAVWIQKLSAHVTAAEISHCDKPLADEVLPALIEANLFALRGCFRASVIDAFAGLAEQASLLLDALPDAGPQRRTLAGLCWGAYMLLGDQRMLRVFVELAHLLAKPEPVAVVERNQLVVGGLEPLLRDVLATASDATWNSPAAEQLRLRALWLALTVYREVNLNSSSLLGSTLFEAQAQLAEIRANLPRRAAQPSSSLRAGERMNLSLALWCSALELRLVDQREGHDALERFLNLAVFAADCLAAVAGNRGSAAAVNFTADGLARDIAATAAASLVLGARLLRDMHGAAEWPAETEREVVAALSAAASALDEDPALFSDRTKILSSDAADCIDEMLRLCSMMWHAFGMEQMQHFMTVRRAHFNALVKRANAERLLQNADGSAIGRSDFAGLIANCVMSDSLLDAAELSAFYMWRVAAIAADPRFGSPLRHEFAELALQQGHNLNLDLQQFVQDLLDDSDGESPLRASLSTLAPENFAVRALVYLNASKGSEALLNGVIAAVNSELAARGDGPAYEDVRTLLDLYRATDAVERGTDLDAEAALQAWEPHAQSWLYPALLDVLYRATHAAPVRQRALAIVDHDPSADSSDSTLLLATALAADCDNSQDQGARTIVSYLRGAIPNWEKRLVAEMNVNVYRSLSRLDPNGRSIYLPKMSYWMSIQMQRDHLRHFPSLAAEGKFFLIFRDYFRLMQFWDLETDLDSPGLRSRLQMQPADRRRAIGAWKTRDTTIPPPIARRGGREVLGADFLVLGTYLFEPPLSEDASFVDERAGFNTAAERSLPNLLRMIVALPDLPASVKDLLRHHSERLYRYSLPPDLTGSSLTAAAS
jgi:hypothetical protein